MAVSLLQTVRVRTKRRLRAVASARPIRRWHSSAQKRAFVLGAASERPGFPFATAAATMTTDDDDGALRVGAPSPSPPSLPSILLSVVVVRLRDLELAVYRYAACRSSRHVIVFAAQQQQSTRTRIVLAWFSLALRASSVDDGRFSTFLGFYPYTRIFWTYVPPGQTSRRAHRISTRGGAAPVKPPRHGDNAHDIDGRCTPTTPRRTHVTGHKTHQFGPTHDRHDQAGKTANTALGARRATQENHTE